jgi:ketosteroid isomerase-like protein
MWPCLDLHGRGLIGSASAGERFEVMKDTTVLEGFLARERAALDPYFGQSDPAAYAKLFVDDATYFDPNSSGKIEGDTIQKHFAAFAGQIPQWRYDILNPSVDVRDGTAVFTFSLETYDVEDDLVTSRWNTTEVHARTPDGWRVIHAHWSHTAPAGS